MVPLSKSGDFIEVEHGTKALRTVLSIQDADHRQPLGIAIRKGSKNPVVENTEDDAGKANSKCQRGYGDGGKAWILSQRASAERDVLQEIFQSRQSPLFTVTDFYLLNAAEFDERTAASFRSTPAAAEVFFVAQMKLSFRLHVANAV